MLPWSRSQSWAKVQKVCTSGIFIISSQYFQELCFIFGQDHEVINPRLEAIAEFRKTVCNLFLKV